MPPLAQTLLTNFVVIVLVMFALWIVGLVRRDVSIVDPFWGVGFVLVAWIAWSLNAPAELRVLLLVGMTTVWGVRLSAFLLWRNWGHGEDRRYAAMRAHHASRFWWVSLGSVFLLQGTILWFVSLPIQVAASANSPAPFGWLDAAGIVIWATGLFFEAVGDWQLARFKADPKNAGRVMDRGLWRYTRHPNYFGDFCIWWGLYLIATAGGAGWTLGSPLLMSLLLLKISGVTLLEKTIHDRRPDYAAYQARTNSFLPGPPKRVG
jgi:steroid 5-alpha reductase family enzyme